MPAEQPETSHHLLDPNPSSIAVVGNGPIRGDYGKDIDVAALVIRMNQFRTDGFQQRAGSKIDAYATWPTVWDRNLASCQLAGSLTGVAEVWIPRPRDWCGQEIDDLIAQSPAPVSFMPTSLWERLLRSSGAGQPSDGAYTMGDRRPQGPSTGTSVIIMALARFPSTPITVTGFDLDPPGGYYDCYFERHCWVQPAHPWRWEKRVLGRLIAAGRIALLR